LTAVL